jgi:hypothetical protein
LNFVVSCFKPLEDAFAAWAASVRPQVRPSTSATFLANNRTCRQAATTTGLDPAPFARPLSSTRPHSPVSGVVLASELWQSDRLCPLLPRMTHVRFIRRGLYFSTNLEYCRLRTRPSCFGWIVIRPATSQRQPVYIRPLSSAHSRPVGAASIPPCLASQTGGASTRHVRTHPEHTPVPNRRCPCSRRKHYWACTDVSSDNDSMGQESG